MSLKYLQAQKFTLAGSGVTASATSVILSSFKHLSVLGSANIVTADLGDICYATLEPGTDREEIISFTGVTQNANGTATLTGVTRNLKGYEPYDQYSASGYAHAGGSYMVVSDNPQLFAGLVDYINGVAVAGAPDASTSVKGNVELATAAQIDADTATGETGAAIVTSPDQLALSKYGTRLPSADQKAALSGTVGTPSASNDYVTAEGVTAMGADQSQSTQNASSAVGEANATTKRNKLAQSFVAADHYLRGVTLNKQADTGSFTGTVTIAIQADSAGSPSGSNLTSKTVTNALWLRYPTGTFYALLSEIATTPGTTYWIVVSTSTSDNANCVNLGTNSAGGYASGALKYNNTTDGWVTVSGVDLTFSTLSGLGGRAIKDTSATAGGVAAAVPAIRPKLVQATVSTGNTAVAHGLGKTPAFIDICHAGADTSFGSFSRSVIDVAAGTVATNGFGYNDGSTAWTVNEVAATGSTSLGIAPSGWVGNNREFYLSYVACDENVAIFTRNSGSAAYAFTFTA